MQRPDLRSAAQLCVLPGSEAVWLQCTGSVAPTRPVPGEVSEEGRLEQGTAFGSDLAAADSGGVDDWPTFRGDAQRSGMTTMPIEAKVDTKWSANIGGRLTSPVIAAGTVYVAQIDTHTLYALNEKSGDKQWTYTAGARIEFTADCPSWSSGLWRS